MAILRLRCCDVDPENALVVRGGARADLSPLECRLLRHLADRPGQVVSREVLLREVWGHHGAARLRSVDHAVKRLRAKIEADPRRPDHLRTVYGQGYRLDLPAADSLQVDEANNLRDDATPFFGRAEVLEAIAARLDGGARLGRNRRGRLRLVTLLGTGGLGKTRAARRFARDHLRRRRPAGGVWFCDLSTASAAAGVIRAVADALQVPMNRRGDHAGRVGRALAARGPCLVVLDNLEQVVEAAAPLLVGWLDAAPEAAFLATSRRALGLDREHLLPLPPLEAPAAEALFVERARRVRAGFDPTPEERARVRALAHAQLEGLPLAIELAAARMGALSLQQLIDRLDQRFKLLRGGRTGAPRHATLRATIEWSWQLLDGDERRALARCAVFRGGFTAPAARAVLGHPDAEALLERLRRHSLLGRTEGRYGALESIREFALEELRAGGGLAAARAAARAPGGGGAPPPPPPRRPRPARRLLRRLGGPPRRPRPARRARRPGRPGRRAGEPDRRDGGRRSPARRPRHALARPPAGVPRAPRRAPERPGARAPGPRRRARGPPSRR